MFKISEILEATGGKLNHKGSKYRHSGSVSTDSRSLKQDDIFIALRGNNFDAHDFLRDVLHKGAAVIIKEKGRGNAELSGMPKAVKNKFAICDIIEVRDTTCALGDLARYHRSRYNIPVIALTGSNGKTTTKEMLAWILSGRYKVLKNEGTKNNHIGVPQTLLSCRATDEVVVVELGTNHFGEIAYLADICRPNAAIITSIGASHLEFFGNEAGVFKEKYSLIKRLTGPAVGILNADHPDLRRQLQARSIKPFLLGFGIKSACDFRAREIKVERGWLSFIVNRGQKFYLKTLGQHNVYNGLAAIAAASVLGLSAIEATRRLKNFTFPNGRLNLISLDRINIIDDTYNSNPLSLKSALAALGNYKTKGRKVFVMADMLELGVHAERFHLCAGSEAARLCDIFVTVGKLAMNSARAAERKGFDKKNIFVCASSEEAKRVLFEEISLTKDDIVLVKGSRGMRLETIFDNK
jgi:UDP-N-acetylmuramoyl-tripeptide--D-alanyl-D-alanine ligase